jgi:signal transduction histidine kinase
MDNAKKFKGNGVGLSIVHRIMKRLGGNVDYESNKRDFFHFNVQKALHLKTFKTLLWYQNILNKIRQTITMQRKNFLILKNFQ